ITELANFERELGRKEQRLDQLFITKTYIQKGHTQFKLEHNGTDCSGNKDTITRKKKKMQKRYINDTLLNLYKSFFEFYPDIKVSYVSFCRLRPFWIVHKKVDARETCLCKLHENVKLRSEKLFRLKIVDSPSPNILMEKIMCGVDRYDCAYGHCTECANRKMPTTNEYTEAVAATKHVYRELKNKKDNLCEPGNHLFDNPQQYGKNSANQNALTCQNLMKWREDVCREIIENYGFESVTWNFTETGHGKSVADGVGGTVKRTADRIVANGKDINDVTALFENVRGELKNVRLFTIEGPVIE
ncbi:hypothetical protein MAR_024503, partial [Mya arenaria]